MKAAGARRVLVHYGGVFNTYNTATIYISILFATIYISHKKKIL